MNQQFFVGLHEGGPLLYWTYKQSGSWAGSDLGQAPLDKSGMSELELFLDETIVMEQPRLIFRARHFPIKSWGAMNHIWLPDIHWSACFKLNLKCFMLGHALSSLPQPLVSCHVFYQGGFNFYIIAVYNGPYCPLHFLTSLLYLWNHMIIVGKALLLFPLLQVKKL